MHEIKISKKLLVAGLALLLLGFILLATGDDTYSFMKLSVAPVVLLGGYAAIAWSVISNNNKINV